MSSIGYLSKDLASHQPVLITLNDPINAANKTNLLAKVLFCILTAVLCGLISFILFTLYADKINETSYKLKTFVATLISIPVSEKAPTPKNIPIIATQKQVLPTVPYISVNSELAIEPIQQLPAEQPFFSKSQTQPIRDDRLLDEPSKSKLVIQASNGENRHIAGLRVKARIALKNNDISTAISALQALLLLKPNDHDLRLLLSRAQYQSGHVNVALSLLQNLPEGGELLIMFLDFRAALLNESGLYQRAIDDYQSLIDMQPNNFRWSLRIAVTYDQLNRFSDAIFAYEQLKTVSNLPINIYSFVEQRLKVLRTRV
jgi:MSHA biogenesis protein MshN